MILAMAVMMPLVMACGGDNDEPNGPNGGGGSGSGGEDEKPNMNVFVPRNGIDDGDGTIFLEKGKIIASNTNYTKAEMEEALTKINWKRQYYIVYDQNYISDKNIINDYRNQIPLYLENGEAWFYEKETFDVPRKYKINGKGFIMETDMLSDRWEGPTKYTIISLDMNDSIKRMVADRGFPYVYYSIPKGLDKTDKTKIRLVWESQDM